MARFDLDVSNTAIADASGIVTISFTPILIGEVWKVTNIGVNNNGTGNPIAIVYKNLVSPTRQLATTINAIRDNCTGEEFYINQSESLIVQFSGCSNGSVCTVRLSGDKYLPGAGFFSPTDRRY